MANKVPRENCPICNSEFYLKPYHKKRYKGPFVCSRKCRGELLKTHYSGKQNPNYRYEDELTKFLAVRVNDIKRRSFEKNIPFDLTVDFMKELYDNQKGLCYYSQIPMKLTSTNWKMKGQADIDAMSVDKIIPELGYTKGNISLCCSGINKLKGNTSPEELKYFLQQLKEHFK